MRGPGSRGKRFRLAALAGLCLCSVTACLYLQPAEIPMTGEYFHYRQANTTLVVLLHGRGGKAANFAIHGTVEQILSCAPGANVFGANSHFGYYRERSLSARLHADIIRPARAAGVTRVWLLGISMGGFGSLVYQLHHPDEVDGIILMAPYLGEWDELEAWLADPAAYRAPGEPIFAEIWRELDSMQPRDRRITLAYGEADEMRRQQRWLAGLLAEDRVVTAPGGHRWTVWQTLWPQALQRSGLCDHAVEGDFSSG
jgi:pimeloyl-ACP methyl ester carboxylesterase